MTSRVDDLKADETSNNNDNQKGNTEEVNLKGNDS